MEDSWLRCPVTGQPLQLQGTEMVTADGQRRYPVVQGVPVLIDDGTSVVTVDEVEASSRLDHAAPRLSRRLAQRLPSATLNDGAPERFERFRRALPTEGGRRPRVLIVGGGTVGTGSEVVVGSADLEVISTDIYISANVDVACDAHRLPFVDRCFDGVVIQAVLEHVFEPWNVVSEIHRVLRPGGIVYAETPFMQQVHEGAYDFTRFTLIGHRRLFRRFEEIEAGVAVGPATALLWSLRYFARAVPRRSRKLATLADKTVIIGFFWLKYLDRWLADHRGAPDAASGVYFLGASRDAPVGDEAILRTYRGTLGSVTEDRGLIDAH